MPTHRAAFFINKDDKEKVVVFKNTKKLLEDILNKVHIPMLLIHPLDFGFQKKMISSS